MSILLVHESDAERVLAITGDEKSEHYLCTVEVDRFGVCKPGIVFKLDLPVPPSDDSPVHQFRYQTLSLSPRLTSWTI